MLHQLQPDWRAAGQQRFGVQGDAPRAWKFRGVLRGRESCAALALESAGVCKHVSDGCRVVQVMVCFEKNEYGRSRYHLVLLIWTQEILKQCRVDLIVYI